MSAYYLQTPSARYPLKEGINTVGRTASNDIALDNPKVSSRHLVIKIEEERITLEDGGSTNGTFIDGAPIQRAEVKPSQRFEIADIPLAVQDARADASSDSGTQLKQSIHARLLEGMELKKLNLDQLRDEELREKTKGKIEEILNEFDGRFGSGEERERIAREVLQDSLGLGPLEDLLEDPTVTEIMVNHSRQVYVERNGRLALSGKSFSTNRQVLEIIERIVAPLGRRIDESSPMVDARLKDGSRVNAVIPPLALRGPCLTIRKFSKKKFGPKDLLTFGSVSEPMLAFLAMAVRHRKNIVISGGTGSGKTTLLNIVSSYIPADERIVTIEDSAELQLPQEHVVALETRPPNIEGSGAVAIRDLVRNSLRMRPDRIVVGECRGGEALDMLQAMNTGHDGSLTTAHANSPRDALARLETMSLMSGTELPLRAIRDQVCSAVDLIVQQSRCSDGSRKITHITEVCGIENERIETQDIFLFRQQGIASSGKVEGAFGATGTLPRFVEEMREKGLSVDVGMFGR